MDDKKCLSCSKRSLNLLSGIYNATCVMCCADLMITAYPSKRHASVLLDSLTKFKDAPARKEILDEVKTKLERCD